jgi:hypothetical protein
VEEEEKERGVNRVLGGGGTSPLGQTEEEDTWKEPEKCCQSSKKDQRWVALGNQQESFRNRKTRAAEAK